MQKFWILIALSIVVIIPLAYADTNGGAIAYRSNASSCSNLLECPHYREWNATSGAGWSSALVLPTAGSAVRFTQLEYSPVNRKRVIVTLANDGNLDSYVCTSADCTVPTNWIATNDVVDLWTTAPTAGQRPYNIAFESKSGDLLLVYDKISTSATQDLFYRIMSNNSDTFGEESNFNDGTSTALDNNYSFVRLATSYSDNDWIGIIALDQSASDVVAWVWNGTLTGYEKELTNGASIGTREVIGIAFERLSGDLIVTSGNGTTAQVYNQWTNTTKAWGGNTLFGTLAIGAVIGVSLVPNSTFSAGSNNIYHVVAGDLNDLDSAVWSGTAWTDHSEHDAAIDGDDTTRVADFAWSSSTVARSNGIFAWGTAAGSISFKRFNITNTFTGIPTVVDSGTHNWIQFASPSNPTTGDVVDAIGATLDSTFDIAGLSWNGSQTNLATTGNAGITTDTVVATYESFDVEWQLSTTAGPPRAIVPSSPTPSSATILTYQSAAFNGTCTALNGTATGINITIQDNLTGSFADIAVDPSTAIFANASSYITDRLDSGNISSNFFFNVTANNTAGKYDIRFQCGANNTASLTQNSTAATLVVNQLNGTLSTVMNSPSTGASVIQNNTFTLSANITCNGGNPSGRCYQVNGTARRNSTSVVIDTNVSITGGAVPLWVQSPSTNPNICAGDLNATQTCTIEWTINASGTVGSIVNVSVNASSSNSAAPTAMDQSSWVTIVGTPPLQILIMYNGSSVPSGWTLNTAYNERLVRGSSSAGGTRGRSFTDHNYTQISVNTTSESALDSAVGGTSGITNSHSHSAGSISAADNASVMPKSKSLMILNATYSTGMTVPAGTVLIFNTTNLPENWTRLSQWDGFFVIGNSTSGQEIGNSTHNHTIPFNSSTTLDSGVASSESASGSGASSKRHWHKFPKADTYTTNVENSPPYISVILGIANATTPIPGTAYAFFDGAPPNGWEVQSNANQIFYNRTIFANSSFGNTGGSEGHNHTSQLLITSFPDNTSFRSDASGSAKSKFEHTHEVNASYTNDSTLPSQIDVIIAQFNAVPTVTRPSFDTSNIATNLTSSTTAADLDADSMSVYFNWSKNGAFMFQLNYTGILNGTAVNSTIASGNYTNTDNISASVWAGDGTFNSTVSTNSIIVDTIPPVLSYADPTPADGTNTTTSNQTFNATAIDSVSNVDTVLFELDGVNETVAKNATGRSIYANINKNLSVATHNYTFWVNDTFGSKNQTPRRNITITADAVDISFTIYISAANATGWDSSAASATDQILFNSSNPNGIKINASSYSGANQSASVSIFRYENTGNTAINLTLAFGTAPTCSGGTITVKAAWTDSSYQSSCNGSIDQSGCTNITATARHIANLSIAGARRDVWLWADYSSCSANLDTTQVLTHTSVE